MAIDFSFKQALIGAAVIYACYYIYWQLTVGARRRAIIKEHGCQPVKKFHVKDPIFGIDLMRLNLKALKERTLLETNYNRFKSEGVNTMTFPNLGRQIIVTTEPENLKSIQAKNFKAWGLGSRRKKSFQPFLGIGIFTTDGADWHHSREMLRPNFVRSQVGDLDTFETHISALIEAIPKDGSTVDLQELFFRLTMDSATEFLFGESTNTLAPEHRGGGQGGSGDFASRFAEAFNRGQETMASSTRWGPLFALIPQKQYEQDKKFVHDFVDYYVRKGLSRRPALLASKPSDSTRYLFIDELVRQTADPIRIRSELLNILLAGRDTTASLLSNVWFTLSKRPDIWARLRFDVASLNGQRPTFEQLKDLKYLRALLNESLRVHPIVPANSREAVVDTVLPLGGGPDGTAPIFIPKGQIVVWNVYTMHRRTDFYGPDAETFDPDRWLGDKGLRPGWEYLPFNGGPRICLGQQFALTEAAYATVRLVQEFGGIESRDPEPWRESLALTCVGAGGCKVGLTPV